MMREVLDWVQRATGIGFVAPPPLPQHPGIIRAGQQLDRQTQETREILDELHYWQEGAK